MQSGKIEGWQKEEATSGTEKKKDTQEKVEPNFEVKKAMARELQQIGLSSKRVFKILNIRDGADK